MSFYAEYRLRAIPANTLEWSSDREEIDFHEELSDILLREHGIICDSEGDVVFFEHQPKVINIREYLIDLSLKNPDYIYLIQTLADDISDTMIEFYHQGKEDYVRAFISYGQPSNELFKKLMNPYPKEFFI